jgi:hypothetical protein
VPKVIQAAESNPPQYAAVNAGPPPALLLYLSGPGDLHRLAVGPALAAMAERAGLGFELYHDALRRGRHFGGGTVGSQRSGLSAGGLAAGGLHAERVLWLARSFDVLAVGDPASSLWPALDRAGAEPVARSADSAELYAAVLERLQLPVPSLAWVLDGAPQGPLQVVTAPFLYPAILGGPPALALDVSAPRGTTAALERLGVRELRAIGVEAGRASRFRGDLDRVEPLDAGAGYAELTAELARRHADWGRGVLVGDPDLIAAQLPKARRLRLLPLYGTPQVDALDAARGIVEAAQEPVFGRQFDDRDFLALAAAGHGLQVLDPSPPFDAAQTAPPSPPSATATALDREPDDGQLERWAGEGRVLVTLLFWCGMLRELDCVPRIVDLVAETGLAAGLVITAETVEHAAPDALGPLSVPVERGGVLGLLEPVLGSTGRGVAAEVYMPPGTLAAHLAEATATIARRLPAAARPRGWWPLLDALLVAHRELPLGRRGRLPVVRVAPRPGAVGATAATGVAPSARRDLRGVGGSALRSLRLDALVDSRRPFDGHRPGDLDAEVVRAVRSAGLEYMWTKTSFGAARPVVGDGGFVALPFTAGNWDGWSPFYTVGRVADLHGAERRLLRGGRPGWLASTIDSPLFALSGEIWEHGARLHEIARSAAAGGRSGRLVNVTPNVVARYARLLGRRASDA